MQELTYGRLTHHSFKEEYDVFKRIYKKLFSEEDISSSDIDKVLSIIVLFSNQKDELINKLGYRMAVAYGLKTEDYSALYDLSINTGLMPVVSLLREIPELPFKEVSGNQFISNITESYLDNFRSTDIVQTEQQIILNIFFSDDTDESKVVIAPTSYGKSELIISTISSSEQNKICILVPSKALLSQTRKRILDENIGWVERIVSHPETHKENDNSSVYVLTQERLTSLLNQNKELSFDIVIIDEAHNILDRDGRNSLLASVIRVLEYRNNSTSFRFLTPFLQDHESLSIRGSKNELSHYKVDEYIKSERFFIKDFRDETSCTVYYDHFTDEFIDDGDSNQCPISYISDRSLSKNIIYFNRPKHIQVFAKDFSDSLPAINTDFITKCANEISANTHEEYLLIHCLKRGILYHHGSMTEAIRNYVEYIYKNSAEIKYLITSSTLMEGVNLPAERLFMMDTRKGLGSLSPSQFKNLIGRINRFSEIFSNPALESLKKLVPEIHIIGTNEFLRKDTNLLKFLKTNMYVTRKNKDKIENVLLEGSKINDANKTEYDRLQTRLENLEEGITGSDEYPRVSTEVGAKLIENNISEIDIISSEGEIQEIINTWRVESLKINDSNTLMSVIYDVFISFIVDNPANRNSSLTRLESDKAQTFYAMFLDWNIEKAPLAVMISRFIYYWENLPEETPVFIGSWGDATKEGSHREVFTYISRKTLPEKINLAIVRIKEEEDFFGYVIFRYIDILNELNLIEDDFYKLSKYSTTDDATITLIQNGFSRSVAELLIKNYSDHFTINDDIISVDSAIHQRLIDDNIGYLQRHELEMNVKGVQ
jgi:predicted metal-dependent hydrolase